MNRGTIVSSIIVALIFATPFSLAYLLKGSTVFFPPSWIITATIALFVMTIIGLELLAGMSKQSSNPKKKTGKMSSPRCKRHRGRGG